jgi:putative transcriptional regulator
MGQDATLGAGKFLVASRDLGDPNFSETVILLIRYDEEQGAMGLVVNRRSDLPLSRVFHDLRGAKDRTDEAYMGGPVEPGNVLALLKSSTKPEEAQRVFASVYLISSKALLEKTLVDKAEPSVFHVYLGYAGWGPGQLEHEVELGAWHIMPPDAASVFDSDPETVWPRLIRRTELRIAQLVGCPCECSPCRASP